MPVSIEQAVTEFTAHFREIIQQAWNDRTAHPGYRPLPAGFPASYGQCVSTSHILFGELQHRFPAEDFRLVRGRVLALDDATPRPVIDPHVWIGWQHADLDRSGVIDATADQAAGAVLPPHLVAAHDALRRRGIIYHAYRIFDDLDDLEAQCAKNEPRVRERIDNLRGRLGILGGALLPIP
jgi:hypothetical protein